MTSPDGLKRLIASLPAESLKRGRAFERLCKWFLENDPIYRMKLQKVWQWDEWPGRWGADAGIDLVAETKDKQLWAIQAKAYSPETTITKADVDTFLSESAREIFSYRLIIATTDRIGSTAERTLHGQQIPAGQLLLTDLANAEVEWPTSITALGPKRSKPKTLRPHQELALSKVLKGFAEHDRGQLVMACGTGKTLTALHVAESLKAKRVLILLPSLSLLSQTVVEWSANSTQPFDFLAVCSDESVVDDDENVHSVSQLAYPVTTRPSEIAKFLKRRQPAMQVIFSTYQSSPRIAEAMNTKGILSFDLALADEAHRLAGQTSSDFATILKPDAIKAKKRLFMTATPRFFTGRIVKIAKERDLELASMDNEELFGPVLHTLSFAEAIEQKLLTDYRVAIIGVDDEAYLDMISKGSLVQTEELKAMGARTLAAHIGFAKAVKKFDIRRAISFHSRVASAKRFAETHAKVLSWMPAEDRPTEPITADYISGNMSAGMRRTRLDRFRSDQFKRSLLCNSRCLTEGIDVPNLDAVIFVDPRRSEVDIVQAVGRAIRLSPDKKIGTIVVPVFIDSGEDAEAALSSSSFKAVWAVLQALRAHDKELGEQFDELRGDLARYPGEAPKLPSKIFVDLPITINHEFGRAISVEVIKQTSSGWNAYFGLLQHFAERTGNSRVPQAHKELGYSLGAWVNSQRLNKVRLTQERVNKLESLPGWSWTPFNDRWQKNYQLLERYVAREGTAHVPVMHVESGVRLGNWIATQRVSRNRLTAERRRKLEELPGWTWDPVNDRWKRNIQLLNSYVDREGTSLVPQRHVENGVKLGSWIMELRKHRDSLAEDRRRILEALPEWSWRPHSDRWPLNYDLLTKFVRREGHAVVPRSHIEEGVKLGAWVGVQRQDRLKLSKMRRDLLEKLPGWTWDPLEDLWIRNFSVLGKFVAREGSALVPSKHVEDDFNLGDWVVDQRRKRFQMSPERQEKLESLPGWIWNTADEAWNQKFELLVEFVSREGTSLVPQRHVEQGVALGSWVAVQRRSKNSLDVDRKTRLEGLPKWSWSPVSDRWPENFSLLQQYVAREGTASVPLKHVEGNVNLGFWVNYQRQRKQKMSRERRMRLESLPGWRW